MLYFCKPIKLEEKNHVNTFIFLKRELDLLQKS